MASPPFETVQELHIALGQVVQWQVHIESEFFMPCS